LLDAALHAAIVAEIDSRPDDGSVVPALPFAWSGVRLHATGATAVRTHLTPGDDSALRVMLADRGGVVVATVDALRSRPVDVPALARATALQPGAHSGPALLVTTWLPRPVPAAAPAGETAAVLSAGVVAAPSTVASYPDLAALGQAVDLGTPAPATVVARWSPTGSDPAAVHTAVHSTLSLAQAWLADARFAGAKLALVTSGAVATDQDADLPDPAAAAVWGLIRSAQGEHPGRFMLVDTDALDGDRWTPMTVALAEGEPEMAVRNGVVHVRA
jgi:polyene macrolide polyketide synthase